MNEQLKDAVITIAGYDGWIYTPTGFIQNLLDAREQYFKPINHFNYHTSADALLDVWRKVRGDKDFVVGYKKGMSWNEEMGVAERNSIRQRKVDKILERIGDGNYPTACIELAEIIKQLKENV